MGSASHVAEGLVAVNELVAEGLEAEGNSRGGVELVQVMTLPN